MVGSIDKSELWGFRAFFYTNILMILAKKVSAILAAWIYYLFTLNNRFTTFWASGNLKMPRNGF